MSVKIGDGTGSGNTAEVTSKHRLSVKSKQESAQHTISVEDAQAYQIIGTATLAAATVAVLHIKNTSSTKNLVITYIRCQVLDPAGGSALPNAANYFRTALNRTYASGGAAATAVNVSAGSGNTAPITAFQTGATLAGTAGEIDRYYPPSEASLVTYNKEGSVYLPPGQSMEVSFVGDHTSGTAYARVSFYMDGIGE